MSSEIDERIRSVRIAQEDLTAELSEAFGVDVIGVAPTDGEDYELLVGGNDE